jgi:hypothetical protein
MDLKETGYGDGKWMHLAVGKICKRNLMHTVINLLVAYKVVNLLTTLETVSN